MRPEQFYQRRSNGGAQATTTTKRACQNPSCWLHEAARPFNLSMIQFAPAAYSRYDGDGIVQRPICDAIGGGRNE